MYLIEKDGEHQQVEDVAGYDGWTVIFTGDPLPPCSIVVDGQVQQDPAAAEAMALEKIEVDADAATEIDFRLVRRQMAIMLLWEELQRLKLANLTAGYVAGLTLTERRKQFPGLMALVALSGNTLAQVATAVENRLWDRVRRTALWQAKVLMAEDAIKAAGTADAKLAAAEISWTE